ncbi:MAG: hypothetical protein IAA25_00945 [Candidatus Ruminococcus intestinipullorum]|nr:hypothetical protein [Candidatus Ruminococcus intestinipullorum]
MYKRAGAVFRVLASLYLIYVGIRIFLQVYPVQPSNFVLMVAAAVLFTLTGIGYIAVCIRNLWRSKR